MRKGWHILSEGEREYVYSLWCRGYTLKEIGDALHISMATAHNALKGRKKVKPKIASYAQVRWYFERLVKERENSSENG